MATFGQWVEGARPRTLPAATAPVLIGTATAWSTVGDLNTRMLGMALLAAVVALALQVGVNYANDYSDGIRGTDDDRVGPMRLVGSGAAPAKHVKLAAFASFGVAALAGMAIVIATQSWWMVIVGLVCILAAWFYTGGRHPYGYLGLGEVMVFVFFGLVAVLGTHHVLTDGAFTDGRAVSRLSVAALAAAIGTGAIASALLVANNLRDIPTDIEAGKRTLATRLGDAGSRRLYVVLVAVSVAAVVVVAATTTWWALLGLAMLSAAIPAVRVITSGALGRDLVPVLKTTGLAELRMGLGVLAGVALNWLW
ncbi:1,4-dihydroxy-2-naphthoate polyprenyltransferase [Propionibacteriaceae bacterium G1746]|uniref:1,4-dihydroxy-2-naphthoate polyprenyltransferase n=1 Tax=Aestuariimicrobium sp. G57 TaxID=3418485 RepID=UPI003C2783D6